MKGISKKTLQDLEFYTVLEQVAHHASTDIGSAKILHTKPFTDEESLKAHLSQVNEYLASFDNDNRIPDHGFQAIDKQLKLLGVENTFLEIQGYRDIASLSETVNVLVKFLKKFKEYYPTLFLRSDTIETTTEVINAVNRIIDRFGEVRDNASGELFSIRNQINKVRAKIGSSFNSALSRYHQADYLDEIRESVIDSHRVLAVKAMHRKKVKGAIMGSSKTGSIVFVEPDATLQLSRELNNLEYEEKEEVVRILKQLTDLIRPYTPWLADYQEFLGDVDVYASKALYAKQLNAVLPKISKERNYNVRDAYHPLLYLTNLEEGKPTYPQSMALGHENRIIVISGPNAGGKSITLKTIGLLQVMLQSGMLIPVHERSEACLFDKILTDIGDNQSIENHLSTYSYRLKNMNQFLKKVNRNTLFLIDEFGTGSDPELGGALAEAFLEHFYNEEAFGVITTHYANLKLLANEMPHMSNANMQFDNRTLEPVFKLVMGEAGSSFTFEVAQKNGIPYSLINKAKKKIERGKVRFDATIAKLQKQRSQMEKTSRSLKEEETKAREEQQQLNHLNQRLKDKLSNYQELYDHNQRMIVLGNRVNDVAERYFIDNKKRPLISALLKLVETENSKRKKTTVKESKERKQKKHKVEQEVAQKITVVRKEKRAHKKKEAAKPKPRPVFKVGDRVRLRDGRAVGSIDQIEKEKAIVNYGLFTTNVSLGQLELVESKK